MEPPPSSSEVIHHVTSVAPVIFGLLMALFFPLNENSDKLVMQVAMLVTVKDVDGHV
jgi:hypothetical protein